jgi:hypothetical protein
MILSQGRNSPDYPEWIIEKARPKEEHSATAEANEQMKDLTLGVPYAYGRNTSMQSCSTWR